MAFLRGIWKNNTKHQKLSEELALQNSKEKDEDQSQITSENDVITFKLKYLGSTVVEKISGDNINTESVKNIIKVTKASRKKLQRVNIAISLRGIVVSDLEDNDILKFSIYRISNCSTDPTHRQVFSFVSTDAHETMECHAFLCSKRKLAETVTLAIAHAFSTAYEAWRILPEAKEFQKSGSKESARHAVSEEKLIDLGDEEFQEKMTSHWVSFDDDFGSERSGFKSSLIMA